MISIPNLPTDNLYKFLSISMLVLFVALIGYDEAKYRDFTQDIYQTLAYKNQLDISKKYADNKFGYLKNRIKEYYKGINGSKQPTVNDTMAVWEYSYNKTGTPNSIERSIDSLVVDYKNTQEDLQKKETELQTQRQIITFKKEDYNRMSEELAFSEILCLILSLGGFLLWYIKYQHLQDVILFKQYKEAFQFSNCQSCNMPLENDSEYVNKTDAEKNNIKFCRHCYQNNQFIEPELTLKQMQERVGKRCIQLGFSKRATLRQVKELTELTRWKKTFTWG